MPSKQKRAQGGGRTPNSEPKLQVFKEFSGINFEHENHLLGGFQADYGRLDPGDQTDLQMNYVFLQNNVATASNKTFETRDNIVTLFDAPEGVSFTGPVCLIGPVLYAARSDNKIGYASITDSLNPPEVMTNTVRLNSLDGEHDDDDNYIGSHIWTSFSYYDDKLIGMTKKTLDTQSSGAMWLGDVSSFLVLDGMYRPQPIQDPTDDLWSHLVAKGTLAISQTMTQQCPFRITLAFDYVNTFGPTKLSPNTVFYASVPVSEWHAGCYLSIENVTVYDYPGIKAVELFYATDNAMDLLFLDRVELPGTTSSQYDGHIWSYDWYGYIDATSMWAVSNLTTPTENYTAGLNTTRMCAIDGRLYFWGDEEQPQRLYIGGNPGNLFSISPGTGGGFVDVEPGTSKCVRYVCKYKTQSGNSIVTMLCDSPNTRQEQRFNLVENTVSISNEQSMKSWQAEQVAGAIGCKSYDGAVVCEDGLYSVSRYGLALTTMTMEYNSQIRTNYVSDPIKTVFTDVINREYRLLNSIILELDGVIYIAFGNSEESLDNVIFCYDIDLKSWWTYTLDTDEAILKMFHIDYDGYREGIGIVTSSHIYLLPTTDSDWEMMPSNHDFLIETAELSTQVPQQGWQYLSQLEFHFDYFIGEMTIHMHAFDMFGRKLDIVKTVNETFPQFNYVMHMRIDQRLMSYVIVMDGTARFRMTHFIARVYTLSNKIGQVWGFDDSISIRDPVGPMGYNNRIHPTFKCYNDIRKAIFT